MVRKSTEADLGTFPSLSIQRAFYPKWRHISPYNPKVLIGLTYLLYLTGPHLLHRIGKQPRKSIHSGEVPDCRHLPKSRCKWKWVKESCERSTTKDLWLSSMVIILARVISCQHAQGGVKVLSVLITSISLALRTLSYIQELLKKYLNKCMNLEWYRLSHIHCTNCHLN